MPRRLSLARVLVPALLFLACAGAACGSRTGPGGPGPGVLLVVVDALRADHLGCYGYDRETDPFLAQLAGEGLRFQQVFSSSPQLIPAHVAILSGSEPILSRRFVASEFEGLNERRWYIPERLPRLAVEFLAQGYTTAAFVDHELLSENFGFARGFQHYEFVDPAQAEDWEGNQTKRVIDHFLQWLRTQPSGAPWFAYVHLNQLERFWSEPAPSGEAYFQPRPELSTVPPVANTDSVFFAVPRSHWRGGVRTLGQYEAAYDDEIRRTDDELGRLFASLRQMGRYDATTVHVLGSFGLQLGEAGMYTTSGRYSRADLGVPWILRPRAGLGIEVGRSLDALVSTLDLAPTLLELEGLPATHAFQGRSLAAVCRGQLDPDPRAFAFASCGVQEGCAVFGAHLALEYLIPLGTEDAQLRRSWTGTWSDFAMQPRLYFYDRDQTPYPPLDGEGAPTRDQDFAQLRAVVLDWQRDMSDVRAYLASPPGHSGLEPLVLERLAARGYIRTEPPPTGDGS